MRINVAKFSSTNGGGNEIFNHFTVNGEQASESQEVNSGVYDVTFTYDPIPGREHGIRHINLINLTRVSDGEDKTLPTLIITRAGKKTWSGRELDGNAICGPNWTIVLLPPKTRVWIGRNWNQKNILLGSWAGNADENPPMFYCQCPPSTKFLRMRFQKNESAWAENARLNAAIEIFAAAKGVKIDQVVLVDKFPEESITCMINAGYGMELIDSSHPLPEPGNFQLAGSTIVGGNNLPAGLQWVLGREHWNHPSYGWKDKTVLFLKRGALQLPTDDEVETFRRQQEEKSRKKIRKHNDWILNDNMLRVIRVFEERSLPLIRQFATEKQWDRVKNHLRLACQALGRKKPEENDIHQLITALKDAVKEFWGQFSVEDLSSKEVSVPWPFYENTNLARMFGD